MMKSLTMAFTTFVASATSADLSFLAIGDWGGGLLHATTSAEIENAKGMAKVASQQQSQFVLGLGDNFYPWGIHSYNHFRFNATFGDVFTQDSLQVPWYFVAGNHDHYGNAQAEVDHSSQCERWNFPALYYTFNKTLPSGKFAQFVMFDSVTIAGMSYKDEESGKTFAANGPADPIAAESQWTWLEQQLAGSQADYLFTVSHYPVWSICEHGPTADLVTNLRPLLKKYHVTAHLSGHDHCLEHIEEDEVMHVLSGAGSLAWYKSDPAKIQNNASLLWHMANDNKLNYTAGFASVVLSDEAAIVRYHGDDGSILYTACPKAPRHLKALETIV